MKRCPECRRDYYDETLLYCLDDGNALLEGPRSESGAVAVATGFLPSDDEPATAIFHSTDAVGEAPTRAQIHTTEQTAVLRGGAEAEPRESVGELSEKQSFSANRAAKPLIAAMVVVTVLVGGFFAYRYVDAPGGGAINSIAVLPFENRSGNADSEYLSDGLAESLIYRLSQLPDLKVSPTSSVFRYKGKETDPEVIAKELGVDSVLTGRITQRGESLTISVELVDARTNMLIWGEKYERNLSELLATQRQMATEISQNLKLKLSGNEKGLTKPYTNSNEAYQLYLKGRFHFSKRNKDDVLKAIEYFQQAVNLDPNFALAYARIAEVYNQMPAYPYLSPHEAFPKAKAAANRALEIDPTLSEAHTALANTLAVYDWNWPESEREFKRGIELDPNNAEAHFRYGQFLSPMGRHEESIREMQRALELEPLDLVMLALLSQEYHFSGQTDKALEQARKTIELEPNFILGIHVLGQALARNEMYEEVIDLSEKTLSKNPNNQFSLKIAGYAYAKLGRRSDAERMIAKFRELAKTEYIQPYDLATIYVALGDKDKAFAELEKSAENRDWMFSQMKEDPFLVPLRLDPRYKDLLKRMNLPE